MRDEGILGVSLFSTTKLGETLNVHAPARPGELVPARCFLMLFGRMTHKSLPYLPSHANHGRNFQNFIVAFITLFRASTGEVPWVTHDGFKGVTSLSSGRPGMRSCTSSPCRRRDLRCLVPPLATRWASRSCAERVCACGRC